MRLKTLFRPLLDHHDHGISHTLSLTYYTIQQQSYAPVITHIRSNTMCVFCTTTTATDFTGTGRGPLTPIKVKKICTARPARTVGQQGVCVCYGTRNGYSVSVLSNNPLLRSSMNKKMGLESLTIFTPQHIFPVFLDPIQALNNFGGEYTKQRS
jgi:hypothetical protein